MPRCGLVIVGRCQQGKSGAGGILFGAAPGPPGGLAEGAEGLLGGWQGGLLDGIGRPPALGGGGKKGLAVQHALSGMIQACERKMPARSPRTDTALTTTATARTALAGAAPATASSPAAAACPAADSTWAISSAAAARSMPAAAW
jgi:hypothetical protein